MTAPANTQVLASRYQLEEQVAAGGTCGTWRATDLALGRTVAVKVLHQGEAQDAQALAEFRAQAQMAGSLCHANVAQVYDYDELGGQCPPYLVMEYVDGPSLAQVLADGPMDLPRALGILSEAAAGLAALHEAGHVHRDLRPAHVLLDGSGAVKLIGLGTRAGGPAADGFDWDLRCLGELARQCLPRDVPPGVATFVRQLRGAGHEATSDLAGIASQLAAALRDGVAPAGLGSAGPGMAHSGSVGSGLSEESCTQPLREVTGHRRRGPGRTLATAAAAAVVLAGVTVAGFGGRHPVAAEPKLAKVDVSRAQLIGRPVGPVVRALRHLDLTVLVRRRVTSRRPPGRVLDVRPSGWVAPESTVVVIASVLPGMQGNGQPSGALRHRHGHPRSHQSDPAAMPSTSASPHPSATPSSSPSPSAPPSVTPSPTASLTTSAAASPSASPTPE